MASVVEAIANTEKEDKECGVTVTAKSSIYGFAIQRVFHTKQQICNKLALLARNPFTR